jgi:hypothetical protein
MVGMLADDGAAAKVSRLGEDDLFELLDGGRGDRRLDPLPVLHDLARSGDAKRVGAQITIEMVR